MLHIRFEPLRNRVRSQIAKVTIDLESLARVPLEHRLNEIRYRVPAEIRRNIAYLQPLAPIALVAVLTLKSRNRLFKPPAKSYMLFVSLLCTVS